MKWTEKILRAREAAETKYGTTPTCVIVRPEVWGELCIENFGDIFELGGMLIAVSEGASNPFEFKIGIENYEEIG